MVLRRRTMSTTRTPHAAISQAFDRESEGYVERWDGSPIVQIWRGRVLASLLGTLSVPADVLDLGCGIGSDAVALAAAGHRVTAIDASPAMVERARARGVAAEVLSLDAAGARFGACFDAVISDFGVLNCLPSLAPLSRTLSSVLRPGGVAALVWMSRHCPVDSVACLARGRAPRRGRPEASVRGVKVPLQWWAAGDVEEALGREFQVMRQEAIGLLDPPPDVGGRPRLRTRLEPYLARLPGLRDLGDHTLLLARRCP